MLSSPPASRRGHLDHSPFFCVKPWMGPPNAPGNQLGMHLVEPGQTQRFVVGVSLR